MSHRAVRNTDVFIHQHPVTPGGAQHKRIHLPKQNKWKTYKKNKKIKKNQGLDFFIFCNSRRPSLQSEILGFFIFFIFLFFLIILIKNKGNN